MEFFSTVILILKNWKYVVQFATLIDQKISQGINEYELKKGMEKINEAFSKPNETVQDVATNASSIDDSFRM